MSCGDYLAYQKAYSAKITDQNILVATAALADVLTPKSANHTLYIQRIVLSITTHFDTAITFDDDGAGPAIAVYIDEATSDTTGQGQIPVVWDFGPVGMALTKGGNLDITIASAGVVGSVHIEGYERLVGPVAAASTN